MTHTIAGSFLWPFGDRIALYTNTVSCRISARASRAVRLECKVLFMTICPFLGVQRQALKNRRMRKTSYALNCKVKREWEPMNDQQCQGARCSGFQRTHEKAFLLGCSLSRSKQENAQHSNVRSKLIVQNQLQHCSRWAGRARSRCLLPIKRSSLFSSPFVFAIDLDSRIRLAGRCGSCNEVRQHKARLVPLKAWMPKRWRKAAALAPLV